MISNCIITRVRRRTSNKQDSSFTVNIVGEIRVSIEPDLSLLVPVGDLRAESVGDIRVDLGVREVIRVVVGADLGEDPIGLFDEVLVDGVGVGGAKVDADVTAEDEDCHEATEDGDLDVVEGSVDLAAGRDQRGDSGSAASAVGGGGWKCCSAAAALQRGRSVLTHLSLSNTNKHSVVSLFNYFLSLEVG